MNKSAAPVIFLGLAAIALLAISKKPKAETPPPPPGDVPADPEGNKSNLFTTASYCCPDNCLLQGKKCKCYNANGQTTYQPASLCKGGAQKKKPANGGNSFNARVFGYRAAA